MGGSGRSSTFFTSSPADLQRQIRDSELEFAYANFGPHLAQWLNSLLADVNDRDDQRTQSRLDQIRAVLKDELEDSFDLRFGGSVSKHTFVDGLSDIDILLVLGSSTKKMLPNTLLNQIASELADKLPRDIEVSKGRIAVTMKYSDGEEIQIIPSVRAVGRLHVPAWDTNEWSKINPEKFKRGLTKRNDECGGKLIPTIKLAKAINDSLPENRKLTGYHIESLAISSFKNYAGKCVVEKMLPFFFQKMAILVKKPIKDSTGQSVHVDQYLGRSNSSERQQLAHILDRIARRMENATAGASLDQWKALFNG